MLDRLNAALGDRYAVERELGHGGMASVWLARDRRHDRLVAIKVLHPELAGAIGVDRFVREIRLTARLQHPNIVPVFDSGVFPGADASPLPWFAMAYIPGESLRARLQRERQLPIDERPALPVAPPDAEADRIEQVLANLGTGARLQATVWRSSRRWRSGRPPPRAARGNGDVRCRHPDVAGQS
jgi:hypothetical protein